MDIITVLNANYKYLEILFVDRKFNGTFLIRAFIKRNWKIYEKYLLCNETFMEFL